ncbi:GerAB/ArcD/ProY family transporter [Bhargavaea beijingensis]|uniref:Spore germination protein (Amino acid permease) n=1 Tax=Bhargavaea beijingensis TaxID=426756 RepID=A0A1G6Y623_9BACL|nr:GerAB/ArcD/ProY family transporter [Bhargavaea beijingensis]MCW1927833.1 GerAB/ArcD/ProY family transporter [Bhargavaea beijingensis]SDD85859.1 spore germination protein (amino acid permease) [Bhargavaea beijingensis]
MIQVSDGKIGTREFFSILYGMMAIRITNSTPNMLLEAGLTAAWMMPLISAVALFVPLLMMLSLMKKSDADLLELVSELTGNFFGRLITFLLFAAVYSSAVLNSRSYSDIVTTMYYPDTAMLMVMVVLILGAAFFIAHRGLEAIGRTALLVVPVFMVTSMILLAGVAGQLNYLYLFPIAGTGVAEVVKGGVGYSSFFADIIIVGVLASRVRTFRAYRKASIWGLWVPAFKMALFLAVYVMMFDYPAVRNIAYPYHHLARLAMIGSLANHVEAVFLALWFIGAALHFAIYLYISAYLLGKTINYPSYKRLLFPLAGLTVILGMSPENHLQGDHLRKLLLQASSALFLLLPVLLWGLDRFRKKGKR